MDRVYILKDANDNEFYGVYSSIVKAINEALRGGAERTYQWVEPHTLLVGGTFAIVEMEVH